MTRVCLPARTPEDWRALLARPDRAWHAGHAAYSLAHVWQHAAAAGSDGFPPEVGAAFRNDAALEGARALLVLPNDGADGDAGDGACADGLLALARAVGGLAAIAAVPVAGPGDALGPTVAEWLADAAAPEAQLADTLAALGLTHASGGVRYGLLRQTAAALAAAHTYAAPHAVVLVHAFTRGDDAPGFDDVAALAALFGGELARPDALAGALASVDHPPERRQGWPQRRLHFAWVRGAPATASPLPPDAQLRDQLAAILGGPVAAESSTVLTYGDPVEVLVRADAREVHVEVPVVHWAGHRPVLAGERRESFPREAVGRLGAETRFVHAVLAARAERVGRFRRCHECGVRNPPEWMHDRATCQGCAQAHHPVVY